MKKISEAGMWVEKILSECEMSQEKKKESSDGDDSSLDGEKMDFE